MIDAIVLAAGEGRRMGGLKQLLPWKDETIIETVLLKLQRSTLDGDLKVILGAEAEKIREVLEKNPDIKARILHNQNYRRGMYSSVLTGLENISGNIDGVLFMLADQPLVSTSLYNRMLDEFRQREPLLLAPSYRGRRGHPLLMDTSLIPEVFKLGNGGEPEGGLRRLLKKRSEDVEYVEVEDRAVVIDLDNREDYERFRPD